MEKRTRDDTSEDESVNLPESITREVLTPGLYVMATPIGNLGDVTLRVLYGLAKVDVLYAEDTRVTQKLLNAYSITRSLMTYHEHNGEKIRPLILQQISQGKSVGIVTDAGTPLISDPGHKLVSAAIAQNMRVTAFPGACAAIAGLTVSGLASDTFRFCGFLPPTVKARRDRLRALSAVTETLIFYETPKRIQAVLTDMQDIFGSRDGCIARELTKKFEEALRGDIADILERLPNTVCKGEMVVVISGASGVVPTDDAIAKALTQLLSEHSLKDSARMASEMFNVSRQDMYARALRLKNAE